MAKYLHPDVLDSGLEEIKNNCNQQLICNAMPSDRADALSKALAAVAMAGIDFTIANGDAGGRKCTVTAKSGVSVTVTGTSAVAALIDGTRLLVVTDETTGQTLTAGNTVNIPTWKITFNDPS